MKLRSRLICASVLFVLFVSAFLAGVWLRPAVASLARRGYGKIVRISRVWFNLPERKANQLYPVMTESQKQKIDGAIRISFVGDLILLRDAVDFAYDKGTLEYRFDNVFARAKKYWQSSDLTIGVFEGPMAGENEPWSTTTFNGDDIPCYLNFPDSFARAVKDAGIGLVTTANNHVLDRGERGAFRTLDVLDAIDLDHTGSYRSKDEYDAVKIVTVRGKRIAILSYTYGSNYKEDAYFFAPETKYITRPIVDLGSEFLEENVALVEADFQRAKAANPDMILVLPHMGEQHQHTPDKTQRFWCDQFVKNGADLILSDHPHNVQPIEWRTCGRRRVLIVHCPGNFTNSFTDFDNDGSMIVQIWLDPETCEPFAVSIVPLYAYGEPDGNYIGLPLHDVMMDESLRNSMSKGELKRAARVNQFVTKVATGTEVALVNSQDRYFVFPETGYVRQHVPALELSSFPKSPFLDALNAAKRICFVGDSVSEGTMNGGYGWWEPIGEGLMGKQISRFALGSMTSLYFLSHKDEIARENADLYIFAYGCNDIRYRDTQKCAMTAEEYVKNVAAVIDYVKGDGGGRNLSVSLLGQAATTTRTGMGRFPRRISCMKTMQKHLKCIAVPMGISSSTRTHISRSSSQRKIAGTGIWLTTYILAQPLESNSTAELA